MINSAWGRPRWARACPITDRLAGCLISANAHRPPMCCFTGAFWGFALDDDENR
jgi:hypothetical protein